MGLRWLATQNFFLGRILITNIYGYQDPARIVTTVDYSPLAIIFMTTVGIMTILTTILMGARIYKGQIPLAGSCSLAIAAACHDINSSAIHPDGYLPPQAAHSPYHREDMPLRDLSGRQLEPASLDSRAPL